MPQTKAKDDPKLLNTLMALGAMLEELKSYDEAKAVLER